jgi:hypothetical protein
MRIIDRANLSPQTHSALERELSTLGTLQEAVLWGRRQTPPVILVESIAQDEYTHDVIATWRDGLVFVFGST